jgi:hypothetical protein
MKKIFAAAILATLSLPALASTAADVTADTSFEPTKFYAGASLGVLNSPNTTTNNFFTANNTTSPGAKVYAGVHVNEYFAIEASTYTNIVRTVLPASQSLLPTSALGVSAVGYLPIDLAFGNAIASALDDFAPALGNFTLFGKLGLAVPSFGADKNLGGIYQMRSVTPTFGLGAEYFLSRQFAVRLEFEKFTNLGQINPLCLLSQQNQTMTATLTTVGLKYQF